jgi:hypothetical protein
MLYHLRPERTYITVFSGITDSPFAHPKEVKEWKHETTHDTCWRDIRTFSDIYFQMADEVNHKIKKDGYEEVAPARMSEHNYFLVGGDLYNWLPVKVTIDPQDEYNYRRLVELA